MRITFEVEEPNHQGLYQDCPSPSLSTAIVQVLMPRSLYWVTLQYCVEAACLASTFYGKYDLKDLLFINISIY
jgi:hypothetical protein